MQERMQENMRNVNEKQDKMRLNSVNSKKKKKNNEFVNMWLVKKHCKKQPKIITHLHHQKKNFFVSVYV